MADRPRVGQVSTDQSLVGLRDAVHVPGLLVTSAQHLPPSSRVSFCNKERTEVSNTFLTGSYSFIVDPFLDRLTIPGEVFWIFPRPELVSGLRHEFSLMGDPIPEDKEEEVTCTDCGRDCKDSTRYCSSCAGQDMDTVCADCYD